MDSAVDVHHLPELFAFSFISPTNLNKYKMFLSIYFPPKLAPTRMPSKSLPSDVFDRLTRLATPGFSATVLFRYCSILTNWGCRAMVLITPVTYSCL